MKHGARRRPVTPSSLDADRGHNQPSGWLLALRVRLDIVAILEVQVHNLSLLRSHGLKPHGPTFPDGSLGSLVGHCPQRRLPTLPVSNRVHDDQRLLPRTPERNTLRQMLDRVECLPVMANQRSGVSAHVLGTNSFSTDLDGHLTLNAGRGRDLPQHTCNQLALTRQIAIHRALPPATRPLLLSPRRRRWPTGPTRWLTFCDAGAAIARSLSVSVRHGTARSTTPQQSA